MKGPTFMQQNIAKSCGVQTQSSRATIQVNFPHQRK